MTAATYFQDSKTLDRLHKGPLGIHVDLYAERLAAEDHCYQSGARLVSIIGTARGTGTRSSVIALRSIACLRSFERSMRFHHRHPLCLHHSNRSSKTLNASYCKNAEFRG